MQTGTSWQPVHVSLPRTENKVDWPQCSLSWQREGQLFPKEQEEKVPDLEEGGGFPLEGPPDRSVSRAKGGRMTLHQRDIKEQKHVSPSEPARHSQ